MDPFSCFLRFIDAINDNDLYEMMSSVDDLQERVSKGGDVKESSTRITAQGWKNLWALCQNIADGRKIIKDLSLCLDENDQHQGTHYIRDGKIEPKGSFIALVHKAQEITERTDG